MKAVAVQSTSDSGPDRKHQKAEIYAVSGSPWFTQSAPALDSPVVRRKASCACGGGCPACQAKSTDLKVSQPNDPAEIEADQIAERVMRMPDTESSMGGIHAKAAPQTIHPNGSCGSGGAPVNNSISDKINSSRGGGSALDPNTRGFMEPRFGADLGGVRIHAGSYAAELNRELSAKAFTLGSDIFFGAGEYQPETSSGKHLLAHELSHIRQGGSAIRRCADKADEAKYDAIIAEITLLDSYKKLDPVAKPKAETIIKEGKDKQTCLYYARKLKILFTTPEKGTGQVATEIRKETAAAVAAEQKRLEKKEAKATLDVEEAATADPDPVPAAGPEKKPDKKPDMPKKPGRKWTVYPTRFGGGSYKVDATDPANIVVKVKVNLVPGGEGTWDDAKNIKKLEDQIEKHASRKGFTLNLEFVNPDNKPDFVADAETVKINANPRWPDAENWGGDARTCAHELFHVLNFPLDRYDYIESHTTNEKMVVKERLTWFLEQMHKPTGFDDPKSLMASGEYPIEEDVCTIAQLDMATCLKAREKLKETRLDFRTPLGGSLPTAGYANIGGSSGLFLNYGLDFGIPLTHKGDWELFVGAHGTFMGQLEGEKRMAFLLGARVGIEKMWTPGPGGFNLGGFAEGGAAFVSDKERLGAGTTFQAGGYGYGGLNLGYKLPSSMLNMSFNAEIGGGITSRLGLHDPQTFIADPKMLPFFTAGLRAAWIF